MQDRNEFLLVVCLHIDIGLDLPQLLQVRIVMIRLNVNTQEIHKMHVTLVEISNNKQ